MISIPVQHKQRHIATSCSPTLVTPGKTVNAGSHTLGSVAKLNLDRMIKAVAQQVAAIYHVIQTAHLAIAANVLVRSSLYRNGVSGLRADSLLTNC